MGENWAECAVPKWPLEKPKGFDQLNITHNQIDGAIAPPTSVRLEACSLYQLKCSLCPETQDKATTIIGQGYLSFEIFKMFIDNNPYIRWVELASAGEVFLNPDLPKPESPQKMTASSSYLITLP